MTIEKLLKDMEKANKFLEMIGSRRFVLSCCFDDCDTKQFTSYRDFKKYLDSEYIKTYTVELLKFDFQLDSHGCADGFFSWFYQYGTQPRKQVDCHVSLCIHEDY